MTVQQDSCSSPAGNSAYKLAAGAALTFAGLVGIVVAIGMLPQKQGVGSASGEFTERICTLAEGEFREFLFVYSGQQSLGSHDYFRVVPVRDGSECRLAVDGNSVYRKAGDAYVLK